MASSAPTRSRARPSGTRPGRPRRTQAERSETTIGHLVAAARELFAQKGFAATSIEDIVQAAQVTRGALYHHFESKTDVFRAVFEAEEQALAAHSYEAAMKSGGDAWERMEAGCLAFLEDCLDAGVAQIVLLDGFSALGWDAMREIEYRYTLANIKQGIELAIREGALRRRPIAPLAHLIFGAVCEAAMTVARADDPRKMSRDVRREVRELFAALRA